MTDTSEIDDLFADEVDVAPSIAANPRVAQVVVALIGVGILVGLVIAIIVSGISSIAPRGATPANSVCDGALECNDLSLDELRALTAIDLPVGSAVLDSSYLETDDFIAVSAEVSLPSGASDPFDGTGYGVIGYPQLEWSTENLTVLNYYGATGEQGALNAEAVLAADAAGRSVVLVEISRVLG